MGGDYSQPDGERGLISLIDNAEGDNGWCLALVEPDGERTFMSFSGVENQWNREWLARLTVAPGSLLYFSGYQLASPCGELLVEWLEELQDDAIYRFWPTYWRYPGCITGADHGLSTFSVTQSSRG